MPNAHGRDTVHDDDAGDVESQRGQHKRDGVLVPVAIAGTDGGAQFCGDAFVLWMLGGCRHHRFSAGRHTFVANHIYGQYLGRYQSGDHGQASFYFPECNCPGLGTLIDFRSDYWHSNAFNGSEHRAAIFHWFRRTNGYMRRGPGFLYGHQRGSFIFLLIDEYMDAGSLNAMKRIVLFLAVGSLHAASYYVASTGNDSTGTGSSGSPWLTLAHAVGAVATGDTIVIVADGNRVTCDTTLPANVTNITVQSSKLAMLRPAGFRVNPAVDSANLGKCQFASAGIVAQGEVHGLSGGAAYQLMSRSGSTFTMNGNWGPNGFTAANGTQIEFELDPEIANPFMPVGTAVPSPLVLGQHYYIVNCSVSPACGFSGATFQVSATSGGSPITITGCDANCTTYTVIGLPIQVNAATDTITSTDGLGAVYANGTPITFASGGMLYPNNLPSPLAQDTTYYIRDLSGNSFKVAATPGGAAIDLTNVGTGMQSFSNQSVPHGWKFSGIEFAPTSGTFLFNEIIVGNGHETSPLSMPSHFEFDRIWMHDFSEAQNGPIRGIAENSTNFNIHDSYIAGMKAVGNGDTQAIAGWSSYGPTAITNNFLESAGENLLYGGAIPTYYPVTNQNKTITGNYFYKPFIWKQISGTATPSGTCLFDAANSPDPDHRGGEWYFDTATSQQYVCVNGTWTTTASSAPTYGVKNIFEFKSARNWTVTGNVFQGSWTDAQQGQALGFGQHLDSGPGFANDHITVSNNKFTNIYRFLEMGSLCTGISTGTVPCVNGITNHHIITNNLAVLGGPSYCGVAFNTATCGYNMWAVLWSGRGSLQDIFDHNTIIQPDGVTTSPYVPNAYLYDLTGMPSPLNDQNAYTNSINSYDYPGGGIAGFRNDFTNTTWNRMALIGGTGTYTGSAGPGNTMTNTSLPANTAAVGFVNAAAGDYHLSPASPYSASNGSATLLSNDGTDLGADIDLLNMATSGAVAGTPPWDQQAGLQLSLGSTQVVFQYEAPTFSVCTATLYTAPARISSNQAASVADSSANSVADGVARQLYISGLNPSTHYWYKLACGGGVLLVGDTYTRAVGSGTSQFSFDWNAAVAMQYSSSRSMSSAVSLPAATRQLIPVAANSVVYVQVGTTGPITILIAP